MTWLLRLYPPPLRSAVAVRQHRLVGEKKKKSHSFNLTSFCFVSMLSYTLLSSLFALWFLWAGHFILIFHIAATRLNVTVPPCAYWVLVVFANGLVLVCQCFVHLELCRRNLSNADDRSKTFVSTPPWQPWNSLTERGKNVNCLFVIANSLSFVSKVLQPLVRSNITLKQFSNHACWNWSNGNNLFRLYLQRMTEIHLFVALIVLKSGMDFHPICYRLFLINQLHRRLMPVPWHTQSSHSLIHLWLGGLHNLAVLLHRWPYHCAVSYPGECCLFLWQQLSQSLA